MVEVICLGELLIDMISTDVDASLEESSGYVRAPGGAPANVAVGISRLGRRSGFIGCVGNDHFGRFLFNCLKGESVDVSHLVLTERARTTLAFTALRTDQAKEIIFYRNPGADMFLSPEHIEEDYLRQASIFHFGSISLIDPMPERATLKSIEIARKNGLYISYDPNYRPTLWESPEKAREKIWSVMDRVDVAKISEEEWEFVTGTKDLDRGVEMIFKKGVKLVVVSQGENGAYYATPRFSGQVPGYKVAVVETLGAGDAFVSALLVRLLEAKYDGEQIESLTEERVRAIVKWANAAGALACTKYGAIPALPRREDVEKLIQE
ncbi:hypothetical protein J7M23_06055 [Candidatus Sumerlaeota bacterium]|nr:hypothetical protein [Candidatus Sumerlaeota bacterium]